MNSSFKTLSIGDPGVAGSAEPGALADRIVQVVPRTMRRIRTEMRAAGGGPLTVPGLRALLFVQRHPGVGLSAVAEHLGMALPSASGLVDRLVRASLLERVTDPDERRRIQLRLTGEGVELVGRASLVVRARISADLARLSTGILEQLSVGLAILETLAQDDPWQTGGDGLMGPAIEVRGLTRKFDDVLAVDHLDLVVDDEVFGLLGPNGAGKTTTIKMLITLLPPTSGSAAVAGYDIASQSGDVRRHIGYVPQLLSADGALTGRENLELSAGLYHMPRSERAGRIDRALEFMDLLPTADRFVRTYSGGMIRRLELAQAMLHRPEVLFLDEPTVGLDPTGRDAVWGRIRELRDLERTTILLTTHHMDEADALCDRVAVMHHGVVAAIGTPVQLKAEVGHGATLDDVFRRATGAALDAGGTYRDVARTRRTASRMG